MTNRRVAPGNNSPDRWSASTLVLGAGFGLTGTGTVMLGVLLPLLSQQWGLRDDAAGFLLFLQFLGSSTGAILSGPNRVRSIMAGYGLLVASAGALAFAGSQSAFVFFFCFGAGLGMIMTSTSLLISDRYGDHRAVLLERLNFAWAVGATAAPILFLPFLRSANPRPLFFIFQGLFLLLFVWVVLRERQTDPPPPSPPDEARPHGAAIAGSLLPLVVLAMCAVGVDSSLSGWLTTYSHRADPGHAGAAALTTSLFWLGIMVSRLIFSTSLLAIIGRQRVLRVALWGVAASVVLLIAVHSLVLIQVASGLCGLFIGPLYPLVLSFLLERSPRGWVFAMAGIGSAFFPWLTGVLSAHLGGLRYGLIAPCGAAFLMVFLLPVTFRLAPSSSIAEQDAACQG